MAEILQPGREHVVTRDIRSEMAVAGNAHVLAKDIAHIDELRTQETMTRMLGLAKTREGLAALIELHGKPANT